MWPENVTAVDVFRRCQITMHAGMGVVYQGISAVEMRAAMIVSRVPRAEWPSVADDVAVMADAAAEYLNERARAK